MYTAQRNAHGIIIVCKGDRARKNYTIILRGSYEECMRMRYEPAYAV